MNARPPSWTTRVLAGLLALLGAHSHDAQAEATKAFTLPQAAAVLEQSLVLRSKQSSQSEDLLAEYIPAAETLDHWTLMLAVRIFSVKLTPARAAEMKRQEIGARRAQGDVLANSMTFSKDETWVIDFVLSQRPIVEHNVMSFSSLADGRLVSYQLARRYYEQDPSGELEDGLRTFMGEIKTKRDVYVKEIDRLSKELLSGVSLGTPAPTPAAAVAEKQGKWTREEAIRELADFGYTPQARGSSKPIDGGSLVMASSDGHDDIVELLLAAGVPVDAPLGSSQSTALLMSVQSGYLDLAATLLKAGANANMKDENGDTPLMHLAKYCDEVELVRTFIELGADVNAATRAGWTPLKEAESQHCPAIARELRKAGASK